MKKSCQGEECMDIFEGFIGIHRADQLTDDFLFVIILALLLVFALVFRFNQSLFIKNWKDVWQLKERQNLFEDVSGNEFFFGTFMTFQTLMLCSLMLFSAPVERGMIRFENIGMAVLTFCIIFLSVFIFYIFKQGLYKLLGFVFGGEEKYSLWKTNYLAINRAWGVTLYLPVCWMIFVDTSFWSPLLLFVFLYFLCRFVILYKTIRIFHTKKHGFLYIILYLCAQEMLPLLLFYQGLIYLYNFIGASTLWH